MALLMVLVKIKTMRGNEQSSRSFDDLPELIKSTKLGNRECNAHVLQTISIMARGPHKSPYHIFQAVF